MSVWAEIDCHTLSEKVKLGQGHLSHSTPSLCCCSSSLDERRRQYFGKWYDSTSKANNRIHVKRQAFEECDKLYLHLVKSRTEMYDPRTT